MTFSKIGQLACYSHFSDSPLHKFVFVPKPVLACIMGNYLHSKQHDLHQLLSKQC